MTNKVLVIYHGGGCRDGFGAAVCARRYYGAEADYLPASYGDALPDVDGKDVIVLDFSYKRPVMLDLVCRARSVVVLDHHESAAKELAGDLSVTVAGVQGPSLREPHIVFDMTKSGAMLAWEHFFPDLPTPWLIEYLQDRDLWSWQLRCSKEVSAAIASMPLDFDLWDGWIDLFDRPPEKLVVGGEAILRYMNEQVERQCKNAVEVMIDSVPVLAVNATMLISEIGEHLCADRKFSASFFVRGDGMVVWSFRSRGDYDCSVLARRNGGGGHKQAAGCTLPTGKLPE